MTLMIADVDSRMGALMGDSERRASQREQLDRLTHAIDQLDDDERLAIHLYYLERNPVAAAREAMQMSRSGYYKILARAREKLALVMNAASA